VGVLARLDRRDDLADVDAVLVDRVADGHVLQRDLVADRDVLRGLDADRLVLVHDPGLELRAGLDAFDDRHRDGVLGVVQYDVNHSSLLGKGRSGLAPGGRVGPC